MKPDKLKKFFKAKRIIALALAAAMVVTSVPQTALAAEADMIETEAAETETAAEADTQQEDEQPAQSSALSENAEQEAEESKTPEATETQVTETTQAKTTEAQEADAKEAENQAEGDGTQTESAYTLEIVGLDAEMKTASYTGNQMFMERYEDTPSFEILDRIQLKENGNFIGYVTQYRDEFTYKWQKDGAAEADPEAAPINAGKYQLVIAAAADGTFAGMKPLTITGFEIKAAEVTVEIPSLEVKPGTAPDKVIDSLTVLNVITGADTDFVYDSESNENKLKVTVDEVIDPYTGSKTADTYLKKNGDYAAKITVSFSDAKDADGNALVTEEEKSNYKLPQTVTEKITVADLKATRTTLENITGATEAKRSDNGAAVKIITKTYGDEISVPAYTVKVEESEPVLDKDGKEQFIAVTPKEGEVTGKWHSAEFRSWTETKKVPEKNEDGTDKKDENGETVYKTETETLCSLTVGGALEGDSLPKEAGTYVYRVTYSGDKEQYASSYADIVTEITEAEVTVKPALSDANAVFYAGETVKDVLTKITWSLDKEGVDGIWGTSYDNDERTQPYEPVFGVYRIEKEEAVLLKDTAKLAAAEGVTYEVRFTGKKAVRSSNGFSNESDQKEINDDTVDSYNSNYKTKTDADTLAANKLTLTLKPSDAKIDTTPITSDSALAAAGLKKSEYTIDGNTIYTKVYKEGGAIYDSRAAYKTVVLDDENLTYKWYKWYSRNEKNDAYYDVKKAYAAVFNGELSFKSNWNSLPVNNNDFNSVKNSLSEAGIYKLEITYDDGASYAQESIYYAIERQQLRFIPTNVPAANYGMDTWNYAHDNGSQFAPKLQMRQDNTGDWIDMDWMQDRADGDYYLDSEYYWDVEAKAPTAKEGEEPEWEGWQWVSSFDYRAGEEGQTPEQNRYRLAYAPDGIVISSRHGAGNYTFEECSVVDEKQDNSAPESKPVKIIVTENLSAAEIAVNKAGEKMLTLKLPEKEIKAEKIYDNTPVTVDLSGIKYVDSDNKEVTPQFVWKWTNEELERYDVVVSPEEAVNAGTYTIYAKFDGNADYAPAQPEEAAAAVIEKAELTVTVKPFTEEVTAGMLSHEIGKAYRERTKAGDILTVTGFPEKETQEVIDAFTKWQAIGRGENGVNYCYPAWVYTGRDGEEVWYNYYLPSLCIYKDGVIVDDGGDDYRLQSGESYTVNISSESEAQGQYFGNYKIKAGAPVEITAVYASSKVSLASVKTVDTVTKGETAEKFAHEVMLLGGVPYTSASVTENGVSKTVYGHWATVRITAPKEYDGYIPDTAVYENALRNAGAVSVSESDGTISAKFNLSKDTEAGLEPNPVTFSIVWKEDFVEKFTITPKQENLAADLRNAVAPKSVAFNAPKTKMVVGEVQDLDVRITKVQNEDLVYLDYRITEGDDVLAISSQGRVTALKEGNASVEVYPVRIENNEKKEITGAKTATVKIAVSKVAAPKVGKVFPADVSADVQYPYVKNNGKYYDYGYRREVYVIEGSKKTAEEFETAIRTFEETGDYKTAGLAANPVYISSDTENHIAFQLTSGGRTEYEYNYNISGLASGKNVTMQVKVTGLAPKTAYSVYVRNVSASRTVLDKNGEKRTVELSSNGIPKDFTTTLGQVKRLVAAAEGEAGAAKLYDSETDETVNVSYYEYDLTAGGAQLSVTGLFSAIADEVDKAETPDLSQGYAIPFAGADKAALKTKLLEPKLDYRMLQVVQEEDGRWSYVRREHYYEEDDYWYDTLVGAQYTKADKKGKLKFAQPEAFAVTAYDTVTGTESAPIIIRIKADADSAAGAKVTLQVGQKTPIVNLVAYKAGKNALHSDNPYFAHTASAEGNDYLSVGKDGTVTPVKFDKAASKQTVTVTAGEGPAVSGAAAVTIKDLDPVKNLKFNNLIDNSFTLDFAPSIYAEGYIVDIKNSAGGLVQRKYISQRDEDLEYNDGYIWYYSTKKKAYTWQPEYMDRFRVTGLTAKSKYNVTVTAVYGDAKSKSVSKAVTMTKIPAWDEGLVVNGVIGGMPVKVFANGSLDYNAEDYAFVSGNRYTLVADANQGAQYAVTDKLTWSSSDGKVAKVSAVGGTYSASLKATKAGTTIIEVKSGILKQTIARWKITVRSVGDAYNNAYFYDENEDLRGDGTNPYDTETKLVLNVPAAVELPAGARQSYSFTAEEAGSYRIVSSGKGFSVEAALNNLKKGQKKTVWVTAGSTNPASGTITVEKLPGADFADRTPLKLNEKLTLAGNSWAVFTAEKDGIYRFNSENSRIMLYVDKDGKTVSTDKSGSNIDYAMKAQDTVYVKNSGSYNTALTASTVSVLSLKTGEQYSGEGYKTYWYAFTAAEDGDYRFKALNNSNIDFSVYKDFDAVNKGTTLGTTCTMKAGDTVYVQVYVSQYSEAEFEVKKVVPVVITDDKTQYDNSAEANMTTRYSLTPSVDAIYTFTLDSSVKRMDIYLDGSEAAPLNYTEWNRTISYLFKAGAAYSIKVDNNRSNDLSLTVEKKAVSALTAGGDAAAFTMSNVSLPGESTRKYGWITFTAPQDAAAFYKFTLDGLTSSSTYVYVMEEPLLENYPDADQYIKRVTNASSSNNAITLFLQAGQKVWFRIGDNSYSDYSNVTVAAEKTESTITPFTTEEVSVAAGKESWYSYAVESDGRYVFGVASMGSNVNILCYDDINQQQNSFTERWLKAGSVVYIRLRNNGSSDAAATLSAAKIEPAAWTDVSVSQTVPGNYEEKWFAFTAPEETEYTFTCNTVNGNSSQYVYLYTEEQFQSTNNSGYLSVGYSVTYPFDKGETVYLKTNAYSEATLAAEKAGLQEVDDGENKVSRIDNDTLVKYIVPETGIYTFASDQISGSLYLYAGKESYIANNCSQSVSSSEDPICYPLLKGTTVYLKIYCYSISDESMESYCITVNMDETMDEVKIGENPLKLTAYDDKWIYYAPTDDNTNEVYISYTSKDNGIYSISYGYNYYFTSNSWQENLNTNTMYSNSSGDSIWYYENKLVLIKLTPENSGEITLKLSKEYN